MKMKALLIGCLAALLPIPAQAVTPEAEAAFIEAYRKALANGDDAAATSLLSGDGSNPEIVAFIKEMTLAPLEPGTTIESIELIEVPEESRARYKEPVEMPDGKTYVLPSDPVRLVVIKTKTESNNSSLRGPVIEKDGKLFVPVPVLAK